MNRLRIQLPILIAFTASLFLAVGIMGTRLIDGSNFIEAYFETFVISNSIACVAWIAFLPVIMFLLIRAIVRRRRH